MRKFYIGKLRRKSLLLLLFCFLILLFCFLLLYVVLRGLLHHNFSEIQAIEYKGNGHIVIFVVVKSSSDLNTEYEIAHSTLRCYCAARHYPLVILDFSNNSTLSALCPQRDFMFRRHCALAHFLSDNPTKIEWVLFLDADIGVVNPSHLVEDYLPKTTSMDREQMIPDLVFYERIFNGEFVAGSYIARNTIATINFLHFWADYFYKLPWRSWHGTDNGAIHAVFMDRFCGDGCSSRRILCMKLWHRSKDDDGLRLFTDCARSALGKRNLFIEENEGRTTTLLLLTDFRHFWARDIWLTESEWNEERDFFLHGFKRKWQNSTKWGGWFSPFCLDNAKLSLEMTAIKCAKSGSQVKNIWQYEPRFMITREKLDIQLIARVREMRMQQMDYWRRIEEYALEEWKDTSETL